MNDARLQIPWISARTGTAAVGADAPSTRPVAARAEHLPAHARKVLFICYHFPPDTAVGAVRPAKFVKYLRRHGWEPYVVTVRERHLSSRERARLHDVAGTPIVRTAVWPALTAIALTFVRRFRRRASSARGVSARASATAPRGRRGFAADLTRIVSSILELPDKQIGWLIPATWAAYRLIRAQGIRVVVTSSPPRTTALVGLLLSYLTPVRLVTDLRDPWFVPYLRDSWFRSQEDIAASRSAAGDRIEQWLEASIVKRSAKVITTTGRHARELRQAYPSLPEARLSIIPNGYDAEDFDSIGPPQHAQKFTIAYFGSFYFDRTPHRFLQAMGELAHEGRLTASDVVIDLVGEVQSTGDGSVADLIRSCGLTECVRIEAPIAYRRCLERMRQADVLLLFQPRFYCSIPAKAFEYLAAGRRILCLAHEGATADLVTDTRSGIVVPPDDVGAIKAGILELYGEFKRHRPGRCRTDVSRYAREALTGDLSSLLDQLI